MNTKTHSRITAPKEKLLQDLQQVMVDAEDLLRATASQAGEGATAARARIQQSMQAAREQLLASEEAVIERTKEVAKVTDQYVHDNPWKAIGISACVGAIVGMLIARR